MNHGLETLVGKTIKGIRKDANDNLEFETTDGPVRFWANGDCCARCYFDELETPTFPDRGALCSAATLGDWQDWPEGGGDVNQQCFGKVDTTAGTFTFTLRLSHNGYYGGEMGLVAS